METQPNSSEKIVLAKTNEWGIFLPLIQVGGSGLIAALGFMTSWDSPSFLAKNLYTILTAFNLLCILFYFLLFFKSRKAQNKYYKLSFIFGLAISGIILYILNY